MFITEFLVFNMIEYLYSGFFLGEYRCAWFVFKITLGICYFRGRLTLCVFMFVVFFFLSSIGNEFVGFLCKILDLEIFRYVVGWEKFC